MGKIYSIERRDSRETTRKLNSSITVAKREGSKLQFDRSKQRFESQLEHRRQKFPAYSNATEVTPVMLQVC